MIIVSQYSYQASTIELRMQFCDIEISVYYLISCAIGVLIDDRIYPVIPRPRRFPDVIDWKKDTESEFQKKDFLNSFVSETWVSYIYKVFLITF